MPKLPEVPPEHSKICRALVAHAVDGIPEPEDSSELRAFQDWIIYLSEAMVEEDYECVVPLNWLQFTDDDIRLSMGLEDNVSISDKRRLAYARKFIDTYGDDGFNEPCFAEAFELPSSGGSKVFYCCLVQTAGMCVADANWYGCFQDRKAFPEALRQDGYWIRSDPAARIPDSTILSRWHYPAL